MKPSASSPARQARALSTLRLIRPPGSAHEYSNANYNLLGLIIEAVSGQSYDDYVRENVTGPAGMPNTDCYDMDCPVENLAIGYWPSDECASGWRNNLYEHTACPQWGLAILAWERDDKRAFMLPLPIIGHWLKKMWGWYCRNSKLGRIPRIPGM